MTKQEAVVVETYTGICMLTGDDRKLAYEYAEKLLGHSSILVIMNMMTLPMELRSLQ